MEVPVVVPRYNAERGERAEIAEAAVEDPPPGRHEGAGRWGAARLQSKRHNAGGSRALQAAAEPRPQRRLPVAASRRLQLRRAVSATRQLRSTSGFVSDAD